MAVSWWEMDINHLCHLDCDIGLLSKVQGELVRLVKSSKTSCPGRCLRCSWRGLQCTCVGQDAGKGFTGSRCAKSAAVSVHQKNPNVKTSCPSVHVDFIC